MVDYGSVLLGASIGFISAVGGDYLKWKLIDEKKFIKEKEMEKEKSTSHYFRENFEIFAPFLALFDEYYYIYGQSSGVGDEREESQSDRFKKLVPKFIEAYNLIKDSGHLSLLPPELKTQIFRFGNFLAVTAKLENEQEDMKQFQRHADLMQIGLYIYKGFRRLLDVESYDEKLADLAIEIWVPK